SLTMSSGALSGSSAISISSTPTITGGTLLGPGTINLPGMNFANGQLVINNRTVSVSGATTQGTGATPATLLIQTGGVINNLAGATWTIGGTAQSGIFNNGGTGNAFNNAGTFTNSNAGATATVSVAFNNTGSVNANAGTLAFGGIYTQTAGVTQV